MEALAFTCPDQAFDDSFPECFGAKTAQFGYYSGWDSLDPNLGTMRYDHNHYGFNLEPNDQLHHRYFSSYDGAAHGFAPEAIAKQADIHLYQLGLTTQWHSDYDRHARYLSPTSSGASLSNSDCSMSDFPLTPDMSKDMSRFSTSHSVYPSPASDMYKNSASLLCFQQPEHAHGFTTPVVPSQSSLSMKDVQFSPDLHAEDDFGEEMDTIIASANVPEVLELSENPSPEVQIVSEGQSPDSEDDETMKDESDDDSEFTPALAPRRQATAPPRSSRRPLRHTTSNIQHSVQDPGARIHKPTTQPKPKAKISHKAPLPSNGTTTLRSKHFPCLFAALGCTAVFPSKNEWKRHTASQHLQLGYYRCDLGACSRDHPSQLTQTRGHNDFNRKDLFTQHCRRMHWEECDGLKGSKIRAKEWAQWSAKEKHKFEEFMEEVRDRCWTERRKAPAYTECGMCTKVFDDEENDEEGKAWEERMEHVGKHYEMGQHEVDGEIDGGLKEWCIRNDIVVEVGEKHWLKGFEPEESRSTSNGTGRRGVRKGLRADPILNGHVKEEEDEVVVEQKVKQEQEDEDTDAEGEADE